VVNNSRSSTLQLVVRRGGARFGLAWIGLLVMVSVLAPFIASSHPWVMRVSGRVSSPLLQNLTALDITLVVASLMALLVWLLRLPPVKRIGTVAVASLLCFLVCSQLVNPSRLTVYEQYREGLRDGEVEWLIAAPVPWSPKDYLRDFGDTGLQPPGSHPERLHLMGTEENGADLLSRMVHASRLALGIGLVATGIALGLGVLLGGLMGYFSGWIDMLGMRLVEVFEAVPTLFLLLTFVAFFDRSLYMMMVIIGLTSWPGYARYVRAEFLRLRQLDYVQAAIVAGLPLRSILFRHILPNAAAPVLVAASFGVASAILAEATLSFLGLGLVDDPSWGQMLNQAVQSSTFNWWMALFPGFAIFMTVFSYNLIGEALRDALDPLVAENLAAATDARSGKA
jgi:peptide/nickel transport system permease protein